MKYDYNIFLPNVTKLQLVRLLVLICYIIYLLPLLIIVIIIVKIIYVNASFIHSFIHLKNSTSSAVYTSISNIV